MERRINKHIFVWLGAFVFGYLGVDRIMRGQILWGVLKLVTLGGCGIWWLVDALIAAYKAYSNTFEDVVFVDGKWA